jgi:hypothetical protein
MLCAQGINRGCIMQESFFTAIGVLVASFLIGISYDFGYNKLPRYDSNETIKAEKSIKDVLIRMVKGVLIIALLAGVIGFMTAQGSNGCSDSDPLYGGGSDCEFVEGTGGTVDTARATFVFTVLVIPFLLGCYKKIKDIKYGTAEKDFNNTMLLKSKYDKKINDEVDKQLKKYYEQERIEANKQKGKE